MPVDFGDPPPKPSPLLEVPAASLVAELSLLDQDRNAYSSVPMYQDKSKTSSSEVQSPDVPNGDRYESYNTWKAKNYQALNAITGSLSAQQISTRQTNMSRKLTRLEMKQYAENNEVHHSQETSAPSTRQLGNEMYNNQINKHHFDYQLSGNATHAPVNNFGHQPYNSYQSGPKYPAPSTDQNYFNSKVKEAYPQVYQVFKDSQSCQTNNVHFQSPHTGSGEMHAQNIHLNNPYVQDCGRIASTHLNQKFNYCPNIPHQSLNMAQLNNQTVIDLYNIIHLQNEQILMLQQQVKQMLQIHLDCNKSMKRDMVCHSCSCDKRNICSGDNRDINTSSSPIKSPARKADSGPRRSVGVMTSSFEDVSDIHINTSPKTRTNANAELKQKKKNKNVSPPSNQQKHSSQRSVHKEEKNSRRPSTSEKKRSKPEMKKADEVEDSFSLNEAELVIRSADQEDSAQDASIHVDLQDYCSFSSNSNDSDSAETSSDEGGSDSGDSSNPQLGWTFYNKVVGQVNNILKKSPPQQDQAHSSRKTFGRQMYDRSAPYETENNWSKRVTFDGPPPDESDNNMLNMREFQKYHLPQPDMRSRGAADRMQDFMMYNFANGNTNLSFSTLRYLEHNNMLPAQRGYRLSDQGFDKINKHTKKNKKKTKDSDMYLPQQNYRSRGRTNSKVLDLTAIKQQPKLM